MKSIVFIDTEVALDGKIKDFGAISHDKKEFHNSSITSFDQFISGYDYICGHNILKHDLVHIKKIIELKNKTIIDTLYLSPLLFPKKPYHRLLKNDKFQVDEFNNPLNDAKKAMDLFREEVKEFYQLPFEMQEIFYLLLNKEEEFYGFFHYVNYKSKFSDVLEVIKTYFESKICLNASLDQLVKDYKIELAYALAIINHLGDSLTPPWVLMNYPEVENMLRILRNQPCGQECRYCDEKNNEHKALKEFFEYEHFREFNGQTLQHEAVMAANLGKSILVVFPTGGGKSLTFQLPALMAGRNESGLTVVISPLQSLMKDQVDNLEKKGIINAVTINGLLDPIERSKAIELVEDGTASLLYISPEMLRSKTIETLLLKRNVVRFVIDEAHCFSSWGHDFRVDYLYIGEFIKNLQIKKTSKKQIPVSCFTATAKQQVIDDIQSYFKSKLSLDLVKFVSSATRDNLKYFVNQLDDKKQKYQNLRNLLTRNTKPTIIYVSRTRDCELLSDKLNEDGYSSTYYHGQLDSEVKVNNQNKFMNSEVQIIVATTAFGMGVDKSDVATVIHYDISSSLENYVQEAGRAGRDESIQADCHILFNEEDLNKHFQLINQTKISMQEISQIWKAIKDLTALRKSLSNSALEIARAAGWDDEVSDIETKVKTAINALEESGYLKRGQNQPHIFADSLEVGSVIEANEIIDKSSIPNELKTDAKRIVKSLVSFKYSRRGRLGDGESRVDYIADRLGLDRDRAIQIITHLKEIKILSEHKDLQVQMKKNESQTKVIDQLKKFIVIEKALEDIINDDKTLYNLKEINETVQQIDNHISMNDIKQLLNYLEKEKLIERKKEGKRNSYYHIRWAYSIEAMRKKKELRHQLSESIINYLFDKMKKVTSEVAMVNFSFEDIKTHFEHGLFSESVDYQFIQSTLYYLKNIGCIKLDSGFIVSFNAMRIERIILDNHIQYKKSDYEKLEKFYENKIQQVHIVGEYARKMIENYKEALHFVNDYFNMNYDLFLHKYFGGRKEELSRSITANKFKILFGDLSTNQLNVIKDKNSKYIVVAAGPGSGKTKLLVHKLASLAFMEDVKHEQMLMLTFSRSSVVEFKTRLKELIGDAVYYIQIATFHSYAFDLLDRVGSIDKSQEIVRTAVEKINNGEVELSRITKTVLVIDEAQDMNADEFALVEALISRNETMRVIAVGDDDQNIYEFRGSDSKYFASLIEKYNAKKYELVDNYRSKKNIVDFANQFLLRIRNRLKENPILSKSNQLGIIKLFQYESQNLTIPVVNQILSEGFIGSVGILTRTNDEALRINGLLLRKGISSKLIQSNEGFNLVNLEEFRFFITYLESIAIENEVSLELFNQGLAYLKHHRSKSAHIEGCIKLLNDFARTSKNYFISDLKLFLEESKLEDFYDKTMITVTVSTIHQAKGREFDNVIFVLDQSYGLNDQELRTMYVAITRAKNNLYIYDCNKVFISSSVDLFGVYQDKNEYDEVDELSIILTHKDVSLGYFDRVQKFIKNCHTGMRLEVDINGCTINNCRIVTFSKEFSVKIDELTKKSYTIFEGHIKNIVYWFNKDNTSETLIILPILKFMKVN